jgi:hypothetical protein
MTKELIRYNKIKFLAYVSYLLISIALENFFKEKLTEIKKELSEKEWKELFQYKSEQVLEELDGKSESKTENDLKEMRDKLMSETQHISFRLIEWWPSFDRIATYGQFVNTGIIIYASIFKQVSFFMLFNLILLAIQFVMAIRELYESSRKKVAEAGLLG